MQRLYAKPLANLTMNVSIVGMNGSGKSAILVKYLTRRFIVEYAPYLSDSYTKNDTVDGQDVTLNIQDTSDSDDMDLEEILKWSQAVVIMFSITSRRSFYRAQELIESIRQNSEMPASKRQTSSQRQSSSLYSNSTINPTSNSSLTSPLIQLSPGYSSSFRRSALLGVNVLRTPTLVLVANKTDLDRFRLVEKSEVEDFAKVHGIPYYETTAAETYEEVQAIFHTVVRLSNSGRFGKVRGGQNGSTSLTGRTLSSSTGALGSTTGSVLSNLAVSPGLLLQKKASPSGLLLPSLEPVMPTSNTENETSSASGPVSRLANLRFRAASPPAFARTLRSPSPSLSVGRPNQLEGCSSTPIISSAQSSTAGGAAMEPSPRATTPVVVSRANPPTLGGKQAAPVEESPNTKTVTAHTTTASTPQAPQSNSLLPPKRSSMGFRFFSKKSK
ncbi:hypothetical protein EG68_01673 [Paragonimus skrjabini miyazakii]|uniref:small monomeric GTPase n=1 Tax=Paragonimus skrjabini miyazakii TaxID=59628 RepID=A0A8S9ZBS4_9TREM|nr:hypothetical protein EG68_01673 [Paragonimus skrjabini miyazakii]